MKYNNETRINKSNENKKRIIEVAIKLINEKGFDNVSVSEITKEAGVSKGAFYIHFESKEDLIEKQINYYYDDLKLDDSYSTHERLEHFLIKSIDHIVDSGLKMAQEWFSHSVLGSEYGIIKLAYDKEYIESLVGQKVDEVVSVYYGALNLWCFTNGNINPQKIVLDYLKKNKEEF
ncbi:MAG: TetR/AcrR family transcriptional regulator [Acholeplasmatales bacterium]|nr:TetR/AcrR family transcriptional regulator [Acholeplasmatales bacterium]